MSREKELAKNTIILSIGRFLPKLFAFITLPILTKYLTKKEYGTYDLIATLVMLIIPIATLQIQSAAFRYLIDCRGDKDKSSDIITNIFIVTIPISLVASIIVQFFFVEWGFGIRLFIIFYFFFDTIYLTVSQIARGLGDNKAYSAGSIIVSATFMVAVVVAVYLLRMGLLGMTIAMASAQIVSSIFLIWRIHLLRYLSLRRVSGKHIKELLGYSWPMVPNNLSGWVLKLSDRLVITGFLGVEANAVYAVANKIPNLLSTAQSVLVMAWHENASIASGDADTDQYYTKMLDWVFDLMFGCTVLLIAATPILFALLIRGDYEEAYFQMPVLILAMFFCVMSSYFGGLYIAHKKTANVGLSTMVAAGINLVIDLVFVKLIGIWAGSISTLVAYATLYFYRMFNCQRFQKINVNYKKQVMLILIMVALLISCFMKKTYLNIINIVVAFALFWIFNRKIVKTVVSSVASKLKLGKKE